MTTCRSVLRALPALLALLMALIAARPAGALDFTWLREFGDTYSDSVDAIAVDASGVYIAGTLNAGGEGDAGTLDRAYFARFGPDGRRVWERTFGSDAPGDAIRGIAANSTGVFVVGTRDGTDLLRGYTLGGKLLWTRRLPGHFRAVAVTGLRVYIAGEVGNDRGSMDATVRKYKPDGELVWSRAFGSRAYDSARALTVSGTGVYVTGTTSGALPGKRNHGHADAFAVRMTRTGHDVWVRQFGTRDSDFATGVAVGSQGPYVTGSTRTSSELPGTAFATKFGFDGLERWTRAFGAPEGTEPSGIVATRLGALIVGTTYGALAGQTQLGGTDAFIRSFDREGKRTLTDQFGTARDDAAASVAIDEPALYVGGWTDGAFPGKTKNGPCKDGEPCYSDAFFGRFPLP